MSENPSVLIVGGGAFGTSTAYHLVHRGYSRVTVLDRLATPSKDTAATDLNKIVRYDYSNPLYNKLGLEAMKIWEAPNNLFSGLFRRTGWIMSAHEMTSGCLQSAYETSKAAGRQGVKFISIPETKQMVKKLVYDHEGTCIGAVGNNGQTHFADIIVLCTGANTAALIDAKDEIAACSHCVGVIQLTPEEVQKYGNLPIVDDFEQGILFPPDENDFLKLCSCRFITNYYNSHVPGASLGHSREDYAEDGVPRQIEDEMREFVRDMIPELADRRKI